MTMKQYRMQQDQFKPRAEKMDEKVRRPQVIGDVYYDTEEADALFEKLETELRDTNRALAIIVDNYLDGNPTDWALGVARRERIEATSCPENGQ